jgi:hypothetical protein
MRPGLALACGRRLLLVVGVAFAALPVGSALADTTIGQVGGVSGPLTGPCPGTAVLADTNYVVPPGGGFINSFSFQLGLAGQQLDFLVLRPVKDNYTVIGHTGLVTLPNTVVATFNVTPPIAVQSGDILGMWFPDQQPVEPGQPGLVDCARPVTPGAGGILATDFGVPDPNVGQTVSFGDPDDNDDLNESANLITPSQDQCRNGGWRNFGQFKNHGDCMSFVATGGKNPPSGS